jgi:Flp pilus assembly protein CpaB
MRAIAPARPWRRRGRLTQAWVALGVIAAACAVLAVLWATGVISKATFGLAAPVVSTRGLVAVPVAPRGVPAYTRLSRDHFWDPVKQQLTVTYLPPRSVTPDMLTKWTEIWGRVLNHEKPAGYVFTEADFLPKGTRPGLVAGIPEGKRAIRVQADKVDGLYGLEPGDRFDLVATLPIDAKGRAQNFGFAGAYAQQLALQAQLTNWQKQATVRVMVQNGVVVEPLTTRQVPVFASSLTQAAVTRMRPIQEVVIAIAPNEVAKLTEAMAVDAKISAVPRSGRPDDPKNSVTPNLSPVSPFTAPGLGVGGSDSSSNGLAMVEAISGSKRELTAVVTK